jgi:hypothetical protein
MSIELLERGASGLSALVDEVVFVGAATIALWITDPGAPPVRLTQDVDVVVEVTSRLGFYEFEDRLRHQGFQADIESGVICRWRHSKTELILDAMPSESRILGFENEWQGRAIPHAITRVLPSGTEIRVVSPPFLLATKIEAFKGRGNGDFLASKDLEDIVVLIDGREELAEEVAAADDRKLREYVQAELSQLMANPRFPDGLQTSLRPDAASQARADSVVLPRLRAIVEAGSASAS